MTTRDLCFERVVRGSRGGDTGVAAVSHVLLSNTVFLAGVASEAECFDLRALFIFLDFRNLHTDSLKRISPS